MPVVPSFREKSVQRENVGRFSNLRSPKVRRQTQAQRGLFRPMKPPETGFEKVDGVGSDSGNKPSLIQNFAALRYEDTLLRQSSKDLADLWIAENCLNYVINQPVNVCLKGNHHVRLFATLHRFTFVC